MSLGILGNARTPALRRLPSMRGTPPLRVLRPMRGYQGLGATVPANCWDTPGFKACNTQGWALAQERCIKGGLADREYGGDWARCQNEEAADYAYYGCALRICPPPTQKPPASSGTWVWKSATANASIQTFQNHLNTCLERNGYKRIAADGKLGPATCGAFAIAGGSCPELFSTDPVENLKICAAFLNPTKVGESQPVPSPSSEEAKKLDAQFGGLPWLQPDPRAPTLQQGLNQQLEGHDFFPITVSGMLDAPMCGGMRWLDRNTGSRWLPSWGQNCKAFTDPRKRPGAVAPVGPVAPRPVGPAPGPAPGPVGPIAPGPAKSSNAMMIAGGLLAAVAVGGYAWYKSKTGGA